jgi:hypothetical protein
MRGRRRLGSDGVEDALKLHRAWEFQSGGRPGRGHGSRFFAAYAIEKFYPSLKNASEIETPFTRSRVRGIVVMDHRKKKR